jgi:hypothetical protein
MIASQIDCLFERQNWFSVCNSTSFLRIIIEPPNMQRSTQREQAAVMMVHRTKYANIHVGYTDVCVCVVYGVPTKLDGW